MKTVIHFLCDEIVWRSNKFTWNESVSRLLPIVPFLRFVIEGYISDCDRTLSIFLQGTKQEDGCVQHNFAASCVTHVIVMHSSSLQKPDKSINGKPQSEYKREIVWRNVFGHVIIHLMGLYGLYVFILSAKIITCVYGEFTWNVLYIFTYS